MRKYWDLWFGALTFQQPAFDAQSAARYSFGQGLALIVAIGALDGVFQVLRATLRYIFSPPLDAIKNTVLVHLQQMPWYLDNESNRAFLQGFQTGYDQWWRTFGNLWLPDPTSPAILGAVVYLPLLLAVSWLLYGSLVHFLARRMNGQGYYGHGLGTLALAVAPQALLALTFFPGFQVGLGLLGLWSLCLNYIAVRTAYRLPPTRAFWVTVLPLLLLVLLLLVLVVVAVTVVGRGARP